MRARRTVLLMLFRELRGLVARIEECGTIHHSDGHYMNFVHEMKRELSLRQSIRVQTPLQKLGYVIRMRRLELGMTQKDLGQLCRLSSFHLSRIEHGRHAPQSETLRSLSQVLNIPLIANKSQF